MGTIKLEGSSQIMATIVSNRFLDEYMPNANGEFVKIYLYLLRAMSSPDMNISICHIADIFNHTEKDVIRALRYWEQIGLLDLKFDTAKTLTNIKLKPLVTDYTTTDGSNIEISSFTVPASHTVTHIHNDSTDEVKMSTSAEDTDAKISLSDTTSPNYTKKVYTSDEINSFNEKSDVVEFMYLAQKLLAKPLSTSEINTLLFFYDVLGFDSDLIVYLLEYSLSNNHRQMRYIEKTAISWANDGIDTVEKAKANAELYSSRCYPVLKAFGISGRNPGAGEKALIVKWTDSYGFNMDIVLDACNRTMNTIHQPSFEYADSILTKWKEKGIRTLSDVKVLDSEHQKNKDAYIKSHREVKETSTKTKNTFNNFNQRTYNYESLEKELLNNV